MRTVIREADVNDVDDTVHVVNESNYRAYRDIIPKEFFKHPVVDCNTILKDMVKMRLYVYEVNGRIVGVAALHPKPDERIGIIRWVYVHPEHQRRGIGTALMKHIEEIARRLNLKKLCLVTHEKAYWTIKFYEKLGYRITSYVQRTTWRDMLLEMILSETYD